MRERKRSKTIKVEEEKVFTAKNCDFTPFNLFFPFLVFWSISVDKKIKWPCRGMYDGNAHGTGRKRSRSERD